MRASGYAERRGRLVFFRNFIHCLVYPFWPFGSFGPEVAIARVLIAYARLHDIAEGFLFHHRLGFGYAESYLFDVYLRDKVLKRWGL